MTARGESSWPFPPGPLLSAGSCLFPVVCPALCAHTRRAPPALGSAFPWSAARRGLHHPGPQPRSVQQTGEPCCGAGGALLGTSSEGAARVREAQAPQQKAGPCGQSRLDAGRSSRAGPPEPGSERMLGP